MLMQIGQEICLIEDPHQALLFSLAATLSVCVFLPHALMIWYDNVSALAIASNPVFLARKKKNIEVCFPLFQRMCDLQKPQTKIYLKPGSDCRCSYQGPSLSKTNSWLLQCRFV